MRFSKKICQELSDLEIIQKSIEQVDYFSCLYERYEEQLLRYIKRLGGVTNEEAEDILQEAFVKIWKNLHAFDQNLKLSSWLYRIVHNQAISYVRKKKSYGKDQKIAFDETDHASPPHSHQDQLMELDIETDLDIRAVLEELPLKYKEVIVLRFLENMSYEEISDVLKIPEGTVAARLNRAKKAFRKQSARHPVLNALLQNKHSI
jgi:RNA polymerase sigma-70 factor (ECF subfamily)